MEPGAPPELQQPPAEPAPRLPVWGRVSLFLLAFLVALFITQGGAGIVFAIIAVAGGEKLDAVSGTMATLDRPPLLLLFLASWASLIASAGVVWLFVAAVDRRPLVSLGLAPAPRLWAQWAAGLGIEGAHFSVLFLIGLAVGWYHVSSAEPPLRALGIVAVAFVTALPAAAAEELATRGYLLQTIERSLGTAAGVVVSAIAFAALHLANPGGASPLPLAGLIGAGIYLSIGFVTTRRLWMPIAMHTAWNVFEGPVYGLPVSGMTMPASVLHVSAGGGIWAGGGFGPEGGLLVILTMLAFAPVAWTIGRRVSEDARA